MPLSYSQLNLYRRCPRQYEFACIKNLPRQITPGESFGSSVHNTLKKWGELEMSRQQSADDQMIMFEDKGKNDLSLTVDQLLELWHQSFIVEGYKSRVEADFARKRGEGLLHQFFEWWEEVPRTVFLVEKGFKVNVDGIELSGRFDRIEEEETGVHIIDFKTSAPRTQREVDADLQLSIYALAAEQSLKKPCARLTLLFLYEDEFAAQETERTDGQLRDAKVQISSIYERIQKRDFYPTPRAGLCRNCPYRTVCDSAAV